MKKTVAAALAAAFVVSTSATTFAAGNPFSDVPAGHWAYNSVAKLAAAGVIEGYGDGTYRGDRNITRYEMAQMIAKAMAKVGGNGRDISLDGSSTDLRALQADLDRLANEFRDELDALGVRVAELEKYADRVVWTGELRYRYWNERTDIKGHDKVKSSNNQLQLRLFPTATVNDHWKVKARLTATTNMSTDESGDFKLTYAFAEGKYIDDKLTLKVGKMPLYSNVDDGLILDDFFSGAQFTYGDKFKVLASVGRWSGTKDALGGHDPANYAAGELSYDDDKLYVGVGYHHLGSDYFRALSEVAPKYYKDSKSANIWTVGAHYNFDNGFNIHGSYAQNTKAREFKKSWTAGLSYKGADRKEAGTWGISADYRYVSDLVSFAPTYDTWFTLMSKKGVELGVDWAPIKNTYAKLGYFWGKELYTNEKTKTFFGRFSWFF